MWYNDENGRMGVKVYNKLVRDKIPEIIESKGESCKVRVLADEEFLFELNKKLEEEVKEYLESGEIEELADIEEVLRAIMDAKKCDHGEFEKIRISKALQRGAFKKKLFLETVKDENE